MENGVWRTVRGHRVFIRNGEDLYSAMERSGKFKNLKRSEYQQAKAEYSINELRKQRNEALNKYTKLSDKNTDKQVWKKSYDEANTMIKKEEDKLDMYKNSEEYQGDTSDIRRAKGKSNIVDYKHQFAQEQVDYYDNLSNNEVYEKGMQLTETRAIDERQMRIKEQANKLLNRIDRANRKGEGFSTKPTEELRELLKSSNDMLNEKNNKIKINDNNNNKVSYIDRPKTPKEKANAIDDLNKTREIPINEGEKQVGSIVQHSNGKAEYKSKETNWREQVKKNNEQAEKDIMNIQNQINDYRTKSSQSDNAYDRYKYLKEADNLQNKYYERFRENERANAKIKQEVPNEKYENVEAYAGYKDKFNSTWGNDGSGTKTVSAKMYTNDEFMEHLEDANWHTERRVLLNANLTNAQLGYVKDNTKVSAWSADLDKAKVERLIKEAKKKYPSGNEDIKAEVERFKNRKR